MRKLCFKYDHKSSCIGSPLLLKAFIKPFSLLKRFSWFSWNTFRMFFWSTLAILNSSSKQSHSKSQMCPWCPLWLKIISSGKRSSVSSLDWVYPCLKISHKHNYLSLPALAKIFLLNPENFSCKISFAWYSNVWYSFVKFLLCQSLIIPMLSPVAKIFLSNLFYVTQFMQFY